MRNEFEEFARDEISLVKRDGTQIDSIKAQVGSGKITVWEASLPFEDGDTLLRKLTNGYTERYTILDTGFRKGIEGIPDRFYMTVRKGTLIANDQVGQVIYNITGENARVNLHSVDASVNISNTGDAAVFRDLRGLISENVRAEEERDALLAKVEEMEAAHKAGHLLPKYQEFIAAAADHMTLLAPLLPALTQLLR